MKKYFLTGLAVLLPVTITLFFVVFIFNLLTEPFIGIINVLFSEQHLKLLPDSILKIVSQLAILAALFIFTLFIGFIGRWLIIHFIIHLTEKLVTKIPVISPVYNTCKDVIKTIFGTSNQSFKQVVLVPYPNITTHCIGFITRDNMKGLGSVADESFVSVFVPCTPNPTSGFLMMFKRSEIIYLEMSVEEAFKYIISCGVIPVPFDTKNIIEVQG